MWVSRKTYEDLVERMNVLNHSLSEAEVERAALIEQMNETVKELSNKAFLVSIERKGRENIFTFLRNGKLFEIRTMGLISDNIPQWKERLLR